MPVTNTAATKLTFIEIISGGDVVARVDGPVFDIEISPIAPHPLLVASAESTLNAGETMRYEIPVFVGALTWQQHVHIARTSLSLDWEMSCRKYANALRAASRRAMGFAA